MDMPLPVAAPLLQLGARHLLSGGEAAGLRCSAFLDARRHGRGIMRPFPVAVACTVPLSVVGMPAESAEASHFSEKLGDFAVAGCKLVLEDGAERLLS